MCFPPHATKTLLGSSVESSKLFSVVVDFSQCAASLGAPEASSLPPRFFLSRENRFLTFPARALPSVAIVNRDFDPAIFVKSSHVSPVAHRALPSCPFQYRCAANVEGRKLNIVLFSWTSIFVSSPHPLLRRLNRPEVVAETVCVPSLATGKECFDLLG